MDATAPSQRQTRKMQKLPDGEATGVDGAVPEIVWPPRVIQPARPPALVFLDLNHYINLARTAAGLETPDGDDGRLPGSYRRPAAGPSRFPWRPTAGPC